MATEEVYEYNLEVNVYNEDSIEVNIFEDNVVEVDLTNGDFQVQANYGQTNIDAIDYIKNKPSINNILLIGDRTLTELGIQPLDSSYVHTDNNYTTVEKNKLEGIEEGAQVNPDLTPYALNSDLTSHTSNTSNPHSVTKAQVGLGNVDNTSDANKPISTATQAALNLKATSINLTSHTSNTSNPHSVTKTQIGLGNVDNTSDANKPISIATQTALNLKANTLDVPAIAKQSVSENIVGLSYNNTTGILSLTDGYLIPTLSAFNNKVDAENNKGLSTNDFSDLLKAKLNGIETGAQVNTVYSVNTKTGAITLTTADIAENSNLYYTNARADARITLQKGAASGLATLGSDSKIPISQIPDSLTSALVYKGTWNASTNTYPSSPSSGNYWIISTTGTISGVTYNVGDWLVYNSTSGWSRVPIGTGSNVTSVNSKTGQVVLSTSDIAEGTNLYYTETRVNNNTNVGHGLTAYGWGNHALAGYALNSGLVHTSGTELIYGNKTFDDETFFNKQVAIGSNTFDTVNPEFLKIDGGESASINIVSAYSNYNNYVQLNIKNSSDGEDASSDFVATADIGQEGSNYIDFGINNSNYSDDTFSIASALDGYAFVDGGNFVIGTSTYGKNIKFFTGGTLANNLKLTVSDSNIVSTVVIGAPNLSGYNTGDETESTIKTKLGISTLSGSNTGDETTSTIKTKLGITTLSGSNTGDITISTANGLSIIGQALSLSLASSITNGSLSSTDWNTFNNKQNSLSAGTDYVVPSTLSSYTPTSRTINSKALTSNITLTTADIGTSTDKKYVSDAQLVVIGNTSGSNTGDETSTSIKTKLGITTLSGSNTGDETTSTIKTKLGITTLSGSNTGDQDLSSYALASTVNSKSSKSFAIAMAVAL